MGRDTTLYISRLALKLQSRHAAAWLLLLGLFAAATFAALLLEPPALDALERVAADDAPVAFGVAPLDALLTAEAVHLALTLGLMSVTLLALIGVLLATRLMVALPAAARVAEALLPKLPGPLPAIRLADLVEQTYRAHRAQSLLVAVTVTAVALGLLSLALHAVLLALGHGTAAGILAAILVAASALLFTALPAVLLAGWLGQRMRHAAARATGKPLPSQRERAGQHWRWLMLDGLYRIDLASEPMTHAAKPAAVRWLHEAAEIASEVHDRLQATLRESGKNKLKGVGQGAYEKFAKKIGAEHVFDPGRNRFSQFAAEDLRLKIDSDATTYRLTLTSSIGAALPGEIVVYSDMRYELPSWATVEPFVERLTVAAITDNE